MGNSAVYETGGAVGIGTTTRLIGCTCGSPTPPAASAGLAVQNLGNTATSYSGMLFYDQIGALGQFQGFNNVTHEYRINNIAVGPARSISCSAARRDLAWRPTATSGSGRPTRNQSSTSQQNTEVGTSFGPESRQIRTSRLMVLELLRE